MKLIETIFGKSSLTSIAGYIVAGLLVVQEMQKAGETNWISIAIAAAIAVLGRVSGDANKAKKDDLIGTRPGDR
ncbi:hypothetical protein AB6805_30675 [Chitinophaga sp. RCC_12]|uniref:hypothetical protein n=1 Tax=Chitinophaga sp. RCC_12 TaxID=3239226 RepID=UPI003525FB6C